MSSQYGEFRPTSGWVCSCFAFFILLQSWTYTVYNFVLVVCSNNVSMLHRFRDISTFTARVTIPVTVKSSSVSITQLKLDATSGIRFTRTYIIANTCYISRGMGVRKVWYSRSDLQGQSMSLLLVLFIGHITTYDFLLVCHCNCVCISYRFQYIISYFPKTRGHVTLNTTHLAVIYHVCASTVNISLHACAHNGLDSPVPNNNNNNNNNKYENL